MIVYKGVFLLVTWNHVTVRKQIAIIKQKWLLETIE